jgi:hypothetical protein
MDDKGFGYKMMILTDITTKSYLNLFHNIDPTLLEELLPETVIEKDDCFQN